MVKFFTIQSEANEMKPNIKEPMRDLDRFIKLDPVMKYCLVDTMVVLPLHQGDADVLALFKFGDLQRTNWMEPSRIHIFEQCQSRIHPYMDRLFRHMFRA